MKFGTTWRTISSASPSCKSIGTDLEDKQEGRHKCWHKPCKEKGLDPSRRKITRKRCGKGESEVRKKTLAVLLYIYTTQ